MARPKRRQRRPAGAASHITTRRGVHYWQMEHERLPGGRAYKSFRTRDISVANSYAGSLQKLMDRGDWDIIARWLSDALHISVIERAVREGDWQSLKRLHQSGPLLGEQADLYIAKVAATKRSGTEALRRSALKLAREHFGDATPMHAITQSDAERYLHAERGGKAWEPNTQASHAASLAGLWAFTIRTEREEAEKFGAEPWLKLNPWRTADRPKQEQTRFTFFTPQQAGRLLAHPVTANTPREALLTTAFDAGLRRGELAYLRTGLDVDIAGGFVHVQSRSGEHEWRPKTDRGQRRVPMTDRLRDALERHQRSGFAGERYFFPSERGDAPPNPRTLDTWTRRCYEAAGFAYGRRGEALTLHSARHSFATWLLEHGAPVPLVARLMGDTVEVILRTYHHHIPDRDQIAVALLNDLAAGRHAGVHFGLAITAPATTSAPATEGI